MNSLTNSWKKTLIFVRLFFSSNTIDMELYIFINLFSLNIKQYILFNIFICFIHNKYFYYRWRIRAVVTCAYPKRSFLNTHGTGEISNWDLTDESGSITLVAFNLNSHIMSTKLVKDTVINFY